MPSHDEIAVYVAIERSEKSWVVGVKTPGSGKVSLHILKPSDTPALIALIERHREVASNKTESLMRVLCCYEAGFEGFWRARCREANGFEKIVLDPSSLLVNRKARQSKTDRIDAKKMVRALLAHDRGGSQVLSRVRVPSVAEEDRKRLLGSALHSQERDGFLTHAALTKALEKLFGYASDERGNRRPLIFSADAGLAESLFMFGVCASLSAYLAQKHEQMAERET